MQSPKFLKAIELLAQERAFVEGINFDPSYLDELFEVIAEFLEQIYSIADVQDLEKRVSLAKQIDTNSLGEAIQLIKEANPQPYQLKFANDTTRDIIPNDILDELKNHLKIIQDNQTSLGQLEILLRIELSFEHDFDQLMMSFSNENHPIFQKLITKTLKKLQIVNDNEMLLLWSRLKSQFEKDRFGNHFINYEEILPKEFWSTPNNCTELRERYAAFVVKYKPFTIAKMIKEGYDSHPVVSPGIARILSLQHTSTIGKIHTIDILIIRSISQIVAIYQKISSKNVADLARALGCDEKSLIFQGEYYSQYKKFLSEKNVDGNNALNLLVNISKRLFEYASDSVANHSKVEQALWQYKMGQEVIAPLRNDDLLKKSKILEDILQKDLSKFLIEKNILSFGRKFGRNSIDLYIKEIKGEDFVIEAKIYKDRTALKSQIEKNFVQLLSYMDQIVQPRGVLAIFNFSNNLIVAPRKWLKGRIWVVVINLCPYSPSKRDQAIEFFESPDQGRYLDFIETPKIIKKKNPIKRKRKITVAKKKKRKLK